MPEPAGAGTLIEASVGGSNVAARDADVVVRSIHSAHIAKRPSATAPPHWLTSDVTVSSDDGVIVGGASCTGTNELTVIGFGSGLGIEPATMFFTAWSVSSLIFSIVFAARFLPGPFFCASSAFA